MTQLTRVKQRYDGRDMKALDTANKRNISLAFAKK